MGAYTPIICNVCVVAKTMKSKANRSEENGERGINK